MDSPYLKEMPDEELDALGLDELLELLDPGISASLREIWKRTRTIEGDWAGALVGSRHREAGAAR